MLKVKVSVSSAKVDAALNKMTNRGKDRPGLHGEIAGSLANLTKGHLKEKYLHKDGTRSDFWSQTMSGVEAEADDSAAYVTLNQVGIRLRYYGGEVRPGKGISSYTGKPTKALAIPSQHVPIDRTGGRVAPKRPKRAGLLAFIRAVTSGETVGYLVEGEEVPITRGKRKGGKRIAPKTGGSLMYTLRTITRHTGDKGILPSETSLIAAATESARDWMIGQK